MMRVCLLLRFCLLAIARVWISSAYEATWESLDARPTPPWYDEAKFGIFIHWGVFSVPSYGDEWFWYHWKASSEQKYVDYVQKTEKPGFVYQDYAHRFDATLYNAKDWANLFRDAGAQYVVLVSKHHEGFCNWDSRNIETTWNWNAMDVGPKRDLVEELSKAVKATTSPFTDKPLRFGLYHSLLEWFNPAFLQDARNNFSTSVFRDTKTMPELYDLVKKYQPEVMWSDGDWPVTDEKYWHAPEFLAWLATNSSVADTVVWNDRWGSDVNNKHGSFFTPVDRYNPGRLLDRKWENALTIDATSWGFNRNSSISDYLTVEYFVHELIRVVAWGGNMLLNVGPSHDGTIAPIFWDRLLGIGNWLKVNGDAIYASKPWKVCQNESDVVFYTRRDDTLYALFTSWPTGGVLELHAPQVTRQSRITMLGLNINETIRFSTNQNGTSIQIPNLTPDLLPCQHAWVLAITGVTNLHTQDLASADMQSSY